MPRAKHEFGQARSLKAASVGKPGERRFHMTVDAEGGSARAWLEKQELLQHALGMQELLVTHAERPNALKVESLPGRDSAPDLEFEVEKLTVTYDRRYDHIVLEVDDEESMEESRATFRVSLDRTLASAFANEAVAVCSAGRPLCPLCQAPMGPAGEHVCPRRNGHILL